MEDFYVATTLVAFLHNFMLISLFIARLRKSERYLRIIGQSYVIVFIPVSVILLFWSIYIQNRFGISLFVGIFCLYVIIELLFDHILKLEFRSNRRIAVPYVILYYLANYVMVTINWEIDQTIGIILLLLFMVQIAVNLVSHRYMEKGSE